MNEPEVIMVDDGERFLNLSMIESISDLPVDLVGRPGRLQERRKVVMVSGRTYDSDGTREGLVEQAQRGAAMAAGVDLDDVRFPAPGRPIAD